VGQDHATFGNVSASKVDGAVLFATQGLQVDADGAPNSYLVDGNGLSPTCDGVVGLVGGRPVNPPARGWLAICRNAWARAQASGDYSGVRIFGFLADKRTNVPYIQQQGDPLPGKAYVSTTTMSIPGSPETSQRHWVDAVKVPYIVLTAGFASRFNVALGDVAVVYSTATGKAAFAVFADTGPALGEASVMTHFALGGHPVAKQSGIDRAEVGLGGKVTTVVFPGSKATATADMDAWVQNIDAVGTQAFDRWGGLNRLRSCSM
jgi:hypothetical protein